MSKIPAILIVDDDEESRKLIECLFEAKNYELIGCRDATIALAVLQATHQPVIMLISSTSLPLHTPEAIAVLTAVAVAHPAIEIIYIMQPDEMLAPAIIAELQIPILRKPLNVQDVMQIVEQLYRRFTGEKLAAAPREREPSAPRT